MKILKRIRKLIVTILAEKFCILSYLFRSKDFTWVSKKDPANISLTLSDTPDVCPHKLSKTEKRLFENSECLDNTEKAI